MFHVFCESVQDTFFQVAYKNWKMAKKLDFYPKNAQKIKKMKSAILQATDIHDS